MNTVFKTSSFWLTSTVVLNGSTKSFCFLKFWLQIYCINKSPLLPKRYGKIWLICWMSFFSCECIELQENSVNNCACTVLEMDCSPKKKEINLWIFDYRIPKFGSYSIHLSLFALFKRGKFWGILLSSRLCQAHNRASIAHLWKFTIWFR